MRGMVEHAHRTAGDCDKCDQWVDESLKYTANWQVNPDGDGPSGLSERDWAWDSEGIIYAALGVRSRVTSVEQPDGASNYRKPLRLIYENHIVIEVSCSAETIYTPSEGTHEADVCEHNREVGGYCYRCPESKAAPYEDITGSDVLAND